MQLCIALSVSKCSRLEADGLLKVGAVFLALAQLLDRVLREGLALPLVIRVRLLGIKTLRQLGVELGEVFAATACLLSQFPARAMGGVDMVTDRTHVCVSFSLLTSSRSRSASCFHCSCIPATRLMSRVT